MNFKKIPSLKINIYITNNNEKKNITIDFQITLKTKIYSGKVIRNNQGFTLSSINFL